MAKVRRATPVDALAIAEVNVASWRGAYAGLLPQPLLDSLSVEGRTGQWRSQLEDPSAAALVAVDDADSVIGFASTGPSRDPDADDGTGELYAIYLHPSVWGGGVGTALHDEALLGLQSGFRVATLWVLSGNARARSFYERHSWATDGAVKADQRGNAVLEEVRYRRRLAADER